MNWNSYYAEQAGYGFNNDNVFKGSYYQKGHGLGGLFRRFFSWIVPIVKQHAVPLVTSGAKEVGKVALESVANIAKDAVSGKNLKDSAIEHTQTAIDSLKSKAEQKLEGKGIKRRRKAKNKLLFKKRKQELTHDIFSQ